MITLMWFALADRLLLLMIWEAVVFRVRVELVATWQRLISCSLNELLNECCSHNIHNKGHTQVFGCISRVKMLALHSRLEKSESLQVS